MNRAIVTLLISATLLSACGARAGYPSLARRPGEVISGPVTAPVPPERISGSAPVATATESAAPAPPPLPLELQSRLARLKEQARAAHLRFSAITANTTGLVSAARGAAVASESWSRASVALAVLESRRSEVMVALGDLDSLYVKDRTDGSEATEIAEVRDQVTAWVNDEDAVLDSLRGKVAG
ncbi:MAG: hypothetical protein ABIW31_00600 [Novosphingobium sp.]